MSSYSLKFLYAPAPKLTRGVGFTLNADPKGQKMLYAHGNAIYIRDLAYPEICESYHGHQNATTVAAYSPSGNYICSGDVTGKVIVWDALQPEHIIKYEGRQLGGSIRDISWNPENNRIAVGGEGKEKVVHAFMWDSGSSVGNMSSHTKTCNSVSMKPTRPYKIVSGGEDYSVNLYAGPPFKLETHTRLHTNFVNKVRYSPDGNVFGSASSDGKVLIYDGKEGTVVSCLGGEKAHSMGVTSLCWGPTAEQLLTVSSDRTAKLWDVEANQCVTTFKLGDKIPGDMQGSCIWAGDYMISVSVNGSINYLDKNNPDMPYRVVRGHEKNINSLVMNDDGSKFYTTSYEGKCLCWNHAVFNIEECKGTGHSSQVSRSVRHKDKVYSVGIERTLRCMDTFEDLYTPLGLPMESDPKDIAISKEGVVFVTCDNHLTIVKNDGIQNTVPLPFGGISASFNSEKNQLALLGKDRKVHLYQYGDDGKLEEILLTEELFEVGEMIRFSPNCSQLAVTSGKTIQLMNPAEDLKITESLTRANARIFCIEWSSDSKILASAGVDSHINVYEFSDNIEKIIIHRAHPGNAIQALQWVGNTLYSTGTDCCVRVWKRD